jgi:hypothetical protein
MKKNLLLLSTLFLLSFSSQSQINIWASAIYLNINGSTESHNTKNLVPPFAIGNKSFGGTLGVFAFGSGSLKIEGAEINTSKSNGFSICSGTFYYTIYKEGERVNQPVFQSFSMPLYCNCNGNNFNGCGGKACSATNEQKYQNVNRSIDLTGMEIGNYVLEVYYQAKGNNGDGNCNIIEVDNSQNVNYKANFSITAPLAINYVLLNGIAEDEAVKIKWIVQNDADILKYDVQKSDNGLNFSTIHTIISSQNSASSTYLFSDATPAIGTNFYRIKAYNDNGTVNLSRVFRIYFGKVGNTLFIYPNPTGNELVVRFAAINKGNYQLSVLGTNGQKILSMTLYFDGIDKTMRFNLPITLSKTVYRLFLTSKYQFYQQSFLVQ